MKAEAADPNRGDGAFIGDRLAVRRQPPQPRHF
jgi:hypothetical protein